MRIRRQYRRCLEQGSLFCPHTLCVALELSQHGRFCFAWPCPLKAGEGNLRQFPDAPVGFQFTRGSFGCLAEEFPWRFQLRALQGFPSLLQGSGLLQ